MGTFNDGDSGSSIRTKINTAIEKTEGTSAISTIDVDGGAIDGVTLGTNSAVTEAQVDNININGNAITSTDTNGNIALTPNGSGEVDISKVDIDGGAIDGVTIGTNSAVTDLRVDNLKADGNTISSTDTNGDVNISPNGSGTVVINTDLDVDNININGNTISSTDTNGDVTIDPNGTGDVNIGNFKFDADQTVGAGQDNYVLTYDNAGGKISLEAAAGGGGGAALYDANESSPSAQPSATGANAIAIGDSTSSAGAQSFAAGDGAIIGSSGTSAVALGTSYANGTDSFAAGIASNSVSYGAIGNRSVAIGNSARATASNHALALGANTLASGSYATAINGGNQGNEATRPGSFAFGRRAKSNIDGKYAFANGGFSAAGDAQGGMYILRADTTDATATVLTTDNSTAGSTDQIVAASDTCIAFHGTIVAMQNGAQSYGGFKVEGLLVNDGGTTSLAASTVTAIQNTSGWTVALSADNTNNALAITVTGEAAHNIRWVANISTSEVTYA